MYFAYLPNGLPELTEPKRTRLDEEDTVLRA
jgi:hypothetical protein